MSAENRVAYVQQPTQQPLTGSPSAYNCYPFRHLKLSKHTSNPHLLTMFRLVVFGRASSFARHLLSECLSVSPSICLSVCLSVCHTRDPRLNGSWHQNTFQTYDITTFLDAKFRNRELRDPPQTSTLKRGTPLSTAKIVPIIRHILGTVQDRR